MMIGILGDIHGNKYALDAVLSSAKKHNVEQLLITGDLVGYYPFAKEVLELLCPWNKKIVAGNHEMMLKTARCDNLLLDKITKKYGSGIEAAIKTLSVQDVDYLVNLPHPLDFKIGSINITLCHGSPVDINEYVYPDCDFTELNWLNNNNSEIILCGHTHYPMHKIINNRVIVNPGSVGQPRNSTKDAHWVLFDTEKKSFDFKLEEYDISKILKVSKITDPYVPYLQDIFKR